MNNESNSEVNLSDFANNRVLKLLDTQNDLVSFEENSDRTKELELGYSDSNRLETIIEELKLTVKDFWSDYLNSDKLLDIDLEFQDLADGQLAKAIVTELDSTGKPSRGTILLDPDADGVDWFIKRTPSDNSEFDRGDIEDHFIAKKNSEAIGKYDLLTAVFHETIHLYGFVENYSGFDRLASEEEIDLDGEHLNAEIYPYDLLNSQIEPGIRKLPSDLDIEILQYLFSKENNLTASVEELSAFLTGSLNSVINGDFSISDRTDTNFGWTFRGGSKIENGQAVLTEDSPFQGSISQNITLPTDAKSLKFTIVETELGSSTSFFSPPDAFEVALLDANTNESLVTDNALTNTDSLLNIQNDGTAYFSDKVRIGGTASGEIIELDKSHTVTVDISHLTAGTEATLYFDLLGFGDVDSRVVIDDVLLSDQNLIPPVAVGDNATTTQGQPVIIDILNNDRDDDGTIAVNSVQIQTEPSNGFVIPREDGTISYIPDTGFAGEDSFTYVVQDNDGQFSEPATVEVTVENVAPEITEIQIPDSIVEGTEFTLSATATDAGNDELTYTWDFEDGTTVEGQNVLRTYADNGSYTGTLTVTDPYGGSDSQAFEVIVDNAVPVVDAGEDKTTDEGSAINFAGSYSDSGTDDIHTVTWDFGDGSTADTSSASHTYTDDGEYTATYTVTDNDGATASDTVTITINNVNPTIESLTGDSSINEGDPATFSAVATDPGDDELTYTWDFGDGSDTVEGNDISHTYTDNGDYTVTLTVRDDDGGETSQTLDIAVSNVAPTFTEVNGATTVNEGEAVEYSATATDPGDDELTYTWNFGERPRADARRKGTRELGDGTPEVTGENATHTFANNGTYNASVTVEDDDGAATTSDLTITVNNVAPSIDTDSTKAGIEGSTVEFTADIADPGTDELTITWDFGDGSDVVTTNYNDSPIPHSATATHTYSQDGTYTATVIVTDSDGAITESEIEVAIDNAAPVIESLTGDTEINEGDTATFNAIATDPGDDTLTYIWDFGDGSDTVEGADASHTYTDNGDYTVTLTVRDENDAEATQTLDVAVSNVAPVIESLTGDSEIDEGDAASFSAIATDAGNDELTYTWDYGDGETGTGADVSHTYIDNGKYVVTLSVDDGDGGVTTSELTITVSNVVPTIEPIEDKTSDEGQLVRFDFSFSDPGLIDTHTVVWNFGDGSELLEVDGNTSSVSHTYADNGEYIATITVTDSDGATTSQDVSVTVNNLAPVIESLTGDTEINEGDTASFSAIATDAGNDELTYTWDFGDGETGTGASISHTYTNNGDYTVALTVEDKDGAIAIQTLDVAVNNVAPVIESLTGDTEINEGDNASFTAIATDAGNDELTYTWNYGDGSDSVTSTETESTHTYADNGEYTVTLTVTDSDGGVTNSELTITVSNVAPIIEPIDDITGNEGQEVEFNFNFTDAGIFDTHTVEWNFGDGSLPITVDSTQTAVSHTYADNGDYEATLTITDNDGASTTTKVQVAISNVAPTISQINGATEVNEGEEVTYNAIASDPGDDTLIYIWDFGDGTEQLAVNSDQLPIEHTFTQNGDYQIELTVADEDGGETTRTLDVTVNNVAPTVEIESTLTGDEGEAVEFVANLFDPGDDELTVSWDFGDGSDRLIVNNDELVDGKSEVNHIYTQNGTYTATVIVTDSDGARSESEIDVTINNVAPLIESISDDAEINEGDSITLEATASDAGDDTLTYTWDLGNGTEVAGQSVEAEYLDNGVYDITLTVSDGDGGVATSEVTITVNNVAPVIEPIDDITGNEGEEVEFNFSFSDAGILDTHTVEWNFGDGTEPVVVDSAETTISHTYADDGVYTATVTITDNDRAISSEEVTVTVNNVAPVVESLTGDTQINEGDTASFSAIATDISSDTLSYIWNFGDGSEETTTDSSSASHIFGDNGNYTVTLTVIDEDGGQTTQTLDVVVDNVAPSIDTESIKTGVEGSALEFTAIIAEPGMNDSLTITWDFGDGSQPVTSNTSVLPVVSEQSTVEHTYTQNGTYTASVTATDSDGATTESTIDVTIDNVAPVIDSITPDAEINEGDTITIEAAASDAGDDTLTYTWDLGNGTEATGESVDATYLDNGVYDVTLTVSDGDGGVTSSNLTITVNNVAPVIEPIDDITGNEGQEVQFDFNFSDVGILDTHTVEWNFGDGSQPVVVESDRSSVNHVYADDGVYEATLTITDNDGAVSTANVSVTINNVAPSINQIIGESNVNEGEAVEYSAIASDPGDDTLTYTWNFGDGTEPITVSSDELPAEHTFTQNGNYTISLTVSDEDGGSSSQTLDVVVNNVAPTLQIAETKTGDEGAAVEFTASLDDAGNDELTITWDFGDGSEAVTNNYSADSLPANDTQSHTYSQDGIYTATVAVTDRDGAVTESTVEVTINNIAPVIESLTGDTEIDEGDTATFNAIASDAGNDELTYTWDFGDGSEQLTVNSEQLPVTHTYADNGEYTVTLTVTDPSGDSTSDTLDITVNNTAPVITDLTDDLTINEGDTASLSALATDAGDDKMTYAWDFGDGSNTVMGQNVEHLFVDNGLYEATVIVTDDDGASVTQSLTITVNNVAPILDPWLDETATEGDTVEFNLDFSDPGSLDTHTLTWDFGDGTELLTTNGSETTVSHIYADNGIYTASVVVTDSDGASSTNTMTVTVNNAAPAITSLTGDTEIDEGSTANFSATATDPGDDELTYTWDFGDGETGTGTEIGHTYTQNGTYTVTLTVRDDDGASVASTLEVTVNNVAPTIESLTGDSQINEGDTASFSAIASDPGDDTLTYTWNFGDGETGTGADISHVYAEDGNYTVELTVTDSDGASTTSSIDLVVNNVAPAIAPMENKTSNEGDEVEFNASFNDPGILDTHTIKWSFGDGNTATDTLNSTHIYTDNGEYDVTLTITDDEDASTTSSLQVTVNNVAPTIVEANGDTVINEGDTASFSATATDPGDDELTYTWNLSDGTVLTGKNASHTFVEDGDYTVELAVQDDDGAPATQTLTIRVNNVAPAIEPIEDKTSNEGDGVEFNASFSDPGILDTHTVEWSFGDGNTATDTLNPTHVYADNGEYDVSLTITDDEGAATTVNLIVTVNNVAPSITEIIGNSSVDEGSITTFVSVATDPGDDELTYTWDFGDGSEVLVSPDPQTPIPHTYTDNGEYTVSLTVTDDDGASDSQTFEIEVNNVAPTITELNGDMVVDEGDSASFNATATDPGADELTYTWDFGDGSEPVEGAEVDRVFTDNGNYTVTLTVTDDDGASVSQALEVTVNNVTPTIDELNVEEDLKEGTSSHFSATASDAGNDELTYTWNFGDGSEAVEGIDVNHTYSDDGDYDVTLTVRDDDGASVSQTVAVTVDNVAPSIQDIDYGSIAEGELTQFTATATDPGDDTITYTWDFGDGSQPVVGSNVNHLYLDDGEFTVTLTVNDEDSGVATSSFVVGVQQVFNLKAEGKVRINGRSDLEAEVLNTDDDSRIYAGDGFTLNGNHDLPVQRDGNGNPIKQGKKSVLVDRAITVGPNYTESKASASSKKYVGIIPPQVIDELSVNVPSHTALIENELATRVSDNSNSAVFDSGQNPLNNQSDWNNRFPAPGTTDAPTVVTVTGGGLNIPNNINISNYVILVENGNINFNGSGHNFDNVTLIAQNGAINLASVQSNNLSVFASNTININGGARFGGDTLIAMGNSNASLHFDGATSTLDSGSNLKVVSQGNIIFNSRSTTKGEFTAAKNFTSNGRSSLIGSIQVKGDITINGGIDLVSTSARSNTVSSIGTEEIIYQFANQGNDGLERNFYTVDEVERDYINNNLDNYEYAGEIFESTELVEPEAIEVFRFFNTRTGNHFYTTDVVERDSIIDNLQHFSYEGVAFSAYSTQVEDTVPMYRFYQADTGVHFYTSDEAEMRALIDGASDYDYEGIAYYVKPLNQ